MLMPLDMLAAGEWAEIEEVTGQHEWVGRLAELGIRQGCRVQVVQPGSTLDHEFPPETVTLAYATHSDAQVTAPASTGGSKKRDGGLLEGTVGFQPKRGQTVAFEIALKIRELSGLLFEAFSAADLMHGPVAAVGPGWPVIAVAPSGPALDSMETAIQMTPAAVTRAIGRSARRSFKAGRLSRPTTARAGAKPSWATQARTGGKQANPTSTQPHQAASFGLMGEASEAACGGCARGSVVMGSDTGAMIGPGLALSRSGGSLSLP